MDKKILSMDKIFIHQKHPWMETFYPWMGKCHPWIEPFYPWIKVSSVEKNYGFSFYPQISSMDKKY